MNMKPPLTTIDVTRVLNRSSRRVHQLADAGVLQVIARTSTGQRLFDADQVEQVRRQREHKTGNEAA
jgi:hypothetical protein